MVIEPWITQNLLRVWASLPPSSSNGMTLLAADLAALPLLDSVGLAENDADFVAVLAALRAGALVWV